MNISSLEEKLVKFRMQMLNLTPNYLTASVANAVSDDIQTTADEKISELKKELETTKVKLDMRVKNEHVSERGGRSR